MILLLFWNIAFLLHVKSFETFAKSVLCQLGQGRIWVNMRNETQKKPTWNLHFLSLSQMKPIDWRANRDGWGVVLCQSKCWCKCKWLTYNKHPSHLPQLQLQLLSALFATLWQYLPTKYMDGQRINIQISPVLCLCTTIADGRVLQCFMSHWT